MNDEELKFVEFSKLENKLAKMQHDETLNSKARKQANILLKRLVKHPEYPMIEPWIVERMLNQVMAVDQRDEEIVLDISWNWGR